MKNDDQWFEPGDKVMRVADQYADTDALGGGPPFNVVLCVARFSEDPEGNLVECVGYPILEDDETEWWDSASDFRKVEEIQLCVRAAEAMKKPKKQEEMA